MGHIIDNEIMFEIFNIFRSQDYFIDKSNIINNFNKLISKDGNKNV